MIRPRIEAGKQGRGASRDEAQESLDDNADRTVEEETLNEDNYDGVDIEKDEHGNFTHSMTVAPEFYGMIIGYKGQSLKKLEHTTRCRITIPKKDDSSSKGKTVILRSSSKRNVLNARSKIMAIVEKSRSKLEPNHFMSFPIDDEQITSRYLQFKNEVLMEAKKEPHKYQGICEEIFQDPGRFHLTICMLLILDQCVEKAQVISKLEKIYQEKIIDMVKNQKMFIKLSGLSFWDDEDINAVSVLYCKIEPNERLQTIADLIADQFKDTPFISRQKDNVSFHLTLMNSSFKLARAREEGRLEAGKRYQREKFSIQELMSKFGDYHFGETQIKTIELSIRNNLTAKGGYESAFTLNLTNIP